jgi:hypothetical protein
MSNPKRRKSSKLQKEFNPLVEAGEEVLETRGYIPEATLNRILHHLNAGNIHLIHAKVVGFFEHDYEPDAVCFVKLQCSRFGHKSFFALLPQ